MKTELTAKLVTALSAMFFVLCLVGIDNSRVSILRSQQRMEMSKQGLSSISSESLPLSVEILQLSIPLQDHSIPPDALTKLPAWTKFQEAVTAYTARCKLLDKQMQELDEHLQWRTLWTSVVAAVLATTNLYLIVRFRRRSAENSEA